MLDRLTRKITVSDPCIDAVPRVAYFVHDIADAAVWKRLLMLQVAGAKVVLIGFNRGHSLPRESNGITVIDLGRTHDRRLLHRALLVLRRWAQSGSLLTAGRGADLLIARNIEMLALVRRIAPHLPQAKVVYECLDLHRLQVGKGMASRLLRRLEGKLLKSVDHIIISSPAFVREHLARYGTAARFHLIENKVLMLGQGASAPPPPPAAARPPWTIGWFGMLRCTRSLDILRDLATTAQGNVNVLIAGKPTPAVFDDFGKQAQAPFVRYDGSYTPGDLPALYSQCHFVWCIDYYEEGLNSEWLLPNRIYEGISNGVVPISLRHTESGRWLKAHDVGILLDRPEDLPAVLNALAPDGYTRLRRAADAVPRTACVADAGDCRVLLDAMLS